jgi:hypothetical protein
VIVLEQEELQPLHSPGYEHAAEQERVMHMPGHPAESTVPGEQTPSPVQPPVAPHAQLDVHVSICVPQFPQGTDRVALGAHTPSPLHPDHPPQLQSIPQVREREPQLPQAPISTVPGAHAPPAVQLPKLPHTQVGWHVRDWVPHMPQACASSAPGSHSPHATQVPALQTRKPAQSRSAAQELPLEHAGQSDPPQSTSVSSPPRAPSAQPSVHAKPLPGSTQKGRAAGHDVPHVPHVAGLLRPASQPLPRLVSQSSQPGSQRAMRHVPPLHSAVAWAGSQAPPQPPQCTRLVLVSTQLPLQSVGASGGHSEAHANESAVRTQRGVGALQGVAHAPHAAGLVRSASHPSEELVLQSAHPSSQLSAQAPAVHDAVA